MDSNLVVALDVEIRAKELIEELANGCAREEGIGSFSSSIYDSAWVAMVLKEVDGKKQCLFPECFEYLIESQLLDGGWPAYNSEVDGILNTMAAVLAMKFYQLRPFSEGIVLPQNMEARLERAIASLGKMLQRWDVSASCHVGFEILVPAILLMLEQEGIKFEFPGRRLLMSLNKEKLAKCDSRILYSKIPTTLIHSLEAFVGQVDYNKLQHHRVRGSMLASPSSTAAYLMNISAWDGEAEEYLREVVSYYRGHHHKGVPSAFPTTNFDLSWVVTTLLEGGFTKENLGLEPLSKIGTYLHGQLVQGNGICGFAPFLLPDADDTAKTILTLNLLDTPTLPDALIKEFEGEKHFRTYRYERNASFSANCNILNALLHVAEPEQYQTQVIKAANFLCNQWWEGSTKDKWNLAPEYPMMLLSQAFIRLLTLWDKGLLSALPQELIRDRIPVILLQIAIKVLSRNAADGVDVMEKSSEEYAYTILTLLAIQTLPWIETLSEIIDSVITNCRKRLSASPEKWILPAYLWVEKVSYNSVLLSQTYCIAALKSSSASHQWSPSVRELANVSTPAIDKFAKFFSQIPLLANEPKWRLKASLAEGYLFAPQLRSVRLDVFPRQEMAEDKYLEYIPFTWTIINNMMGADVLSAEKLWDMMLISMLNYQADEYMEAVVGKEFEDNMEPVKQIIRRLCGQCDGSAAHVPSKRPYVEDNDQTPPGLLTPQRTDSGQSVATLADVEHVLARFVKAVLGHKNLQEAGPFEQKLVREELSTFLLAHISQSEENGRFSCQGVSNEETLPFLNPQQSYYRWVHTTSADHTSCPYSFAFFSCLISAPGVACFSDAQQKYISQDLCRHLATMCRQYNDYGSVARDRAEQNINSINFPEFHPPPGKGCNGTAKQEEASKVSDADLKMTLLSIAEYERESMLLAVRHLEKMMPASTMAALKLFINVTDFYGQIYVARDIASRMR